MRYNKQNSIIRKISAFGLIFLGILGCIFPVLPGFIFIFIGLSVLSKNFAQNLQKTNLRFKYHRDPKKFATELFGNVKELITSRKNNINKEI